MDEVEISIKGDGISITKKTSLLKAGQIITFLSIDDSKHTALIPMTNTPVLVGETFNPKISPRQLLLESHAQTNSQKILTFAKYLTDKNGIDCSAEEIKSLFTRAGENIPQNFSRDMRKAIELN